MALYEKLSTEEVKLHEVKLARAAVIFMELLHVLLGRNRDILRTVSETRKRRDASSTESYSARGGLQYGIPPSPGQNLSFFNDGYHQAYDDVNRTFHGGGSIGSTMGSTMDRMDKAMAIQRELQLSFISMTKALHPVIKICFLWCDSS